MKMQQAELRCAQAGIYFTRQAIYDAGKKYGFTIKSDNSKNLELDEEKFNEWLKFVTEKIPEGFHSMKECAKALNISVVTVWKWCKEHPEIETKKVGSKKGVTYVNIDKLREVIKICKYGIKE